MVLSYLDEKAVEAPKPSTQLEYNYRGFTIHKRPAYNMFFIFVPEGKKLTKDLEGTFTQTRLMQSNIDTWLEVHSVDDAFSDIPAEKPKRGRPKGGSKIVKVEENRFGEHRI